MKLEAYMLDITLQNRLWNLIFIWMQPIKYFGSHHQHAIDKSPTKNIVPWVLIVAKKWDYKKIIFPKGEVGVV